MASREFRIIFPPRRKDAKVGKNCLKTLRPLRDMSSFAFAQDKPLRLNYSSINFLSELRGLRDGIYFFLTTESPTTVSATPPAGARFFISSAAPAFP
jgi:hypothetical protein